MTPGSSDAPNRPSDEHDPSIVPGLVDPGPAPRTTPAAGSRGLDMSQDPDRYDPTRPAVPPGPLDMSQDPDRYDPRTDPTAAVNVVGPRGSARVPHAGQGKSLTDLVGKSGAHEDERDNYTWALGLLGVLAFLALVAFLFGEVLNNY